MSKLPDRRKTQLRNSTFWTPIAIPKRKTHNYFTHFFLFSGCFVAGTQTGFKIYNSDPLRQTEAEMLSTTAQREWGGVKIAEMLFRCNYVALVCENKPTEVKIWDDAKKRFVITLDAGSDVKAIKLRRDRIVVVLENLIKVTFDVLVAPLNV